MSMWHLKGLEIGCMNMVINDGIPFFHSHRMNNQTKFFDTPEEARFDFVLDGTGITGLYFNFHSPHSC